MWAWLWLPLAVAALHQAVNYQFGFENDILGGKEGAGLLDRFTDQFPERVGLVLSYYGREVLLDPSSSGLVFVFLGLAILFPARLVRNERIAPTLMITAVLAGYVLIFIASPHYYIDWHLSTAATRTAWHVVPTIVLWIAMAVSTLYPSSSAQRS